MPRGYRPVDKEWQNKIFDRFLDPPGHILQKFLDFRGEVGGVFGPNVLLALLINPCKFQENVNLGGKKNPITETKEQELVMTALTFTLKVEATIYCSQGFVH